MNDNTLARALGLLLTAALLFGCVFAVRGVGRTEPLDDRADDPAQLQPEALSTERTGGFTASDDSEEETEEEPPEDEPQPTAAPEEPEPTTAPDDETEPEDDTKKDTSDDAGDNTDDSGKGDGGDTGDDDGDDEPEGPYIITNLDQYVSAPVTPSMLENGMLSFTARAAGGTGLSLEVRYRHADDSGNGTLLYVNGRQDYKTTLEFGQNYITLILRQNGKTLESKRYSIRYRQSADEENPESGDHPPQIRMASPDESEWPVETSNRNFDFNLNVTDTHTGKRLPASNISVTVRDASGKTIAATAHGYSYELWLERPNIGDVNVYTITVTAWDEDGCSASYRSYTLTYDAIDSGDTIGTATIVIDATTVGMGILDIIPDVEVRQDVSAAQVVLDALTEYGYSVDYAGSVKVGFYIRSLNSGAVNTGSVPEKLWTMIQRDGIGLMDSGTSDSLGEFDYTRGSGWMYSINGTVYADKGMSERYLQNGDTLYLRYTLAYGKDIGGYGATGSSYGTFSEYCCRYIGGEEIFIGHAEMEEKERMEPTETEPGYILRECPRCGEQEREELPVVTPSPEPTGEEPTPTPEVDVTPPPEIETTPTPAPSEDPSKPEEPEGEE